MVKSTRDCDVALHLVLYQPEIPPNTGNIIRLCANSGAYLHIIEPCAFSLDDKQCRRAGLDYHAMACVKTYASYTQFQQKFNTDRMFACTTKAKTSYVQPNYQDGDMFVLGPETRGLPDNLLRTFPAERAIKIPMLSTSRSMNLANAAGIILYEAWRQLGFSGVSYS